MTMRSASAERCLLDLAELVGDELLRGCGFLKHPLCWPAFQRVAEVDYTFGVRLHVTGHAVYAAGDAGRSSDRASLVGTVEADGHFVHAGYLTGKLNQREKPGMDSNPWTVWFVKSTMMPMEIGSGFGCSIPIVGTVAVP
jgi:hypothetical protein